ncbi:FecCD family ABC transporter permease [Actinoplanes sp. HUAS TT8]|uniref:FecCD family ABC transporter permease n=1 Tax=Actinoplanes sp. HUAS TT8 TaxID=3447453 RepID=UPI003F521563
MTNVLPPVRDAPAAPPPSTVRTRYAVVITVLVLLTPVVLGVAAGTGAVSIPLGRVCSVIAAHLTGVTPSDALADQIVWQVRLPRVLLAFLVGAGLAVAGAVLQVVVRNPLADPYVLGVSSGAALAAVAALTLTGAAIGVSAAAFLGAVATLALVLFLGRRRGLLDPTRLLLAGVALSYLFQAGTTFLQLRVSSNQLAAVLFWLLGTVSGAQWSALVMPLVLVAAATGWLLGQARRLNALYLGDDAAASLGVDAHRLRWWLLIVAAALTAVVIAVAGGVGFVGLVAPHAVRLLIGADHRRLLPAAALTGGLFLVLADLVGRVAAAPLELPLGVVTAVAGVPFFLVLLRRAGVA